MKSKYLPFEMLALMIILLIFLIGCSQKEEVSDNEIETPKIVDEENQNLKISDSLKFCLQEYVYGKEDNWVNLAEEHCEPLLPSKCLFGYGKEAWWSVEAGKFDYNGGDYIPNGPDSRSAPNDGRFGVYC